MKVFLHLLLCSGILVFLFDCLSINSAVECYSKEEELFLSHDCAPVSYSKKANAHAVLLPAAFDAAVFISNIS